MKYELPGVPQPLQRHKHCRSNTYDPQKALKQQALIIIRKFIKAGFEPYQTPIKLTFEYHMPIPKSWSKKKKAEMEGKPHGKRPDLSNLIKFTEDAFNNVIWDDDSLIVQIEARKIYAASPKTVFWVDLVEDISTSQGFEAVTIKKEQKTAGHNSNPEIDTTKFREILLHLITNFKGVNQTSLNHLLFLIDFGFYEVEKEHLIGATYIKTPSGPQAVEMKSMLDEMVKSKEIKRARCLFSAFRKPFLRCFSEKELLFVNKIVGLFFGKPAVNIKKHCLRDLPVTVASPGKEIDYGMVFYRGKETSQRPDSWSII